MTFCLVKMQKLERNVSLKTEQQGPISNEWVIPCSYFAYKVWLKPKLLSNEILWFDFFLSQWVNSKLKVPIHEHSKNNLNSSSKRRSISVVYFLFIHYLIWSVMVSNANLGFHFSDAIKFQLGCSDKYDILSGQNAKIRKKCVTENRTTRPNIKWVRIIPCSYFAY